MIIFILFCSLISALAEMRSFKHSVVMSSQSKPNYPSTHSGYLYSKVNDQPGIVSPFGHGYIDKGITETAHEKYGSDSSEDKFEAPDFQYADPMIIKRSTERLMHVTEPLLTKFAADLAISKAEAKYNSRFPKTTTTYQPNTRYERLKSMMHYNPPENTLEPPYGYDMTDYHMDDDDVRTNSRSVYDVWPYLYPYPYEYEHLKIDSEIEKAKDKRSAIESTQAVIPVYENVNDVPDSYESVLPLYEYHGTTSDNPIMGNAPFFSFVLNDYFDKSIEENPLNFKGFEWGKEFDFQPNFPNIDEYVKKKRRLENDYYNTPTPLIAQNTEQNIARKKYGTTKEDYGETDNEKYYDKKHECDEHEKGKDHKESHNKGYEHNGKLYKSFKDFIDSFSNKFGGDDYKKDSKFELKINQDKGEKKKGFRRVYHKDEYQEDNEFYDNNNKSANTKEIGSSKAHYGGSEAILKSHALGEIADEANIFKETGNVRDKGFDNNNKSHEFSKGQENQFNKYRGVAKTAAESNNADYRDHFRI